MEVNKSVIKDISELRDFINRLFLNERYPVINSKIIRLIRYENSTSNLCIRKNIEGK